MTRARITLLLIPVTLFGSVLTGSAADRVFVSGPEWHELGAAAWAGFSRHAGLAICWRPIEAIGSTLLMIGAASAIHVNRDKQQRAALALFFVVAFSIIGPLATFKAAAPIMLARQTQ